MVADDSVDDIVSHVLLKVVQAEYDRSRYDRPWRIFAGMIAKRAAIDYLRNRSAVYKLQDRISKQPELLHPRICSDTEPVFASLTSTDPIDQSCLAYLKTHRYWPEVDLWIKHDYKLRLAAKASGQAYKAYLYRYHRALQDARKYHDSLQFRDRV